MDRRSRARTESHERRLEGLAIGATTGLALAALEALARYLPAHAGTDLVPAAVLPSVAAFAYVGIGALAGLLHRWLGPAALFALSIAAPEAHLIGALLALAAAGLGVLGARWPRWILGLAVGAALALHVPRAPAAHLSADGGGRASRPDILLIVLDTVGARHTSLHGYALDTTPTLERLAREGVWFRNAVAAAPWTVPSHASLFTGASSRTTNCHHEHPALGAEPPTTAEILADTGYRTAAFVANPWVGRWNGLTRGFAHQEHTWEAMRAAASFGALGIVTRLLPARTPKKGGERLVDHLLGWLEESDQRPAFAFLNLMEAHSPFHHVADARRYGVRDPQTIGERTHEAQMHGPDLIDYPRPGEVESAKRLYAAAIRSADELVGRVIDELARTGRLERTVVIATSDHGEAFGQHGFHGHMVGLYEDTLHVPLVLRHPASLPVGRVVDEVVSLARVHDTIVQVGTGAPRSASLIGSWRDPAAVGTAVSEQRRPIQVLADYQRSGDRDLSSLDARAVRVRAGDLVLLRETPVGSMSSRDSLFDLATDPQETRNLLPDPRAASLRAALEAHAAAPVSARGDVSLPTDLREHLQALGYLGGG